MTTELTKAAQQALEAYDAFADADDFSTLFELTRKMNVLRDLTQRPAAQTEREAFEAWARPNGYDLRRNDVLGHYSSIDTSRAWDGFRAGRASLPAPQQATSHVETDWISNVIRDVSELPDRSSPDDEPDMMLVTAAELRSILETHAPQQATPERHLTVTTDLQGEAVMVSWQDDEHRILEVVWERKQATPEPVGEPVARVELMQTGGNAGLATRIVEIDDPLRERLRPGDLLFARPAPGVPDAEDLRDRLVAISSAVADSDDRAAQSMLSETLRLLAAAQAKGADQ